MAKSAKEQIEGALAQVEVIGNRIMGRDVLAQDDVSALGFIQNADDGREYAPTPQYLLDAIKQDETPETEKTPMTLRQRAAGLLTQAQVNMQEQGKAEHAAFQLTPLEWYPIRRHLLAREIHGLRLVRDEIMSRFDDIKKAIKADIAEALDDKNKLLYSNEDKRRAEYEIRLAMVPGYIEAQDEAAAIAIAINRLEIDEVFVAQQFEIALLEKRHKIARAGLLAAGYDAEYAARY